MTHYKWASPYEWLEEKAATWTQEQTFQALMSLAMQAGNDEIQDLFQSEMDEDGYFSAEKHPCSVCGEPTEFDVDAFTAPFYLCDDCVGTEEAYKLDSTNQGGYDNDQVQI